MSSPFDDAVAAALLGAIAEALEQKREIPPADALHLYALSAFFQDEGIGGHTAWDPHAERVLQNPSMLMSCAAGLKSASNAYAAQLDLLVAGHAGVPSRWLVESTRVLITERDRLGRAVRASEEWFRASDDPRLVRRWRVTQVAMELADERAYEAAIDLLSVALEVRRHSGEPKQGEGRWWESVEVPWWADVMRWSIDGMTNEDIAETWLIPALARAAERREAEAGGDES